MITLKQTASYMLKVKKLFLFCAAVSLSCALWAQNSGTTGNLKWNLATDGTLTVSGTGAMPDYGYNYYYARIKTPWNRKKVTKVIINMGVTSIGNNAFIDCINLTSITIPNSRI